jgi:hypothetical protein
MKVIAPAKLEARVDDVLGDEPHVLFALAHQHAHVVAGVIIAHDIPDAVARNDKKLFRAITRFNLDIRLSRHLLLFCRQVVALLVSEVTQRTRDLSIHAACQDTGFSTTTRFVSLAPYRKISIHTVRADHAAGSFNSSAFNVLERMKPWSVWGGYARCNSRLSSRTFMGLWSNDMGTVRAVLPSTLRESPIVSNIKIHQ